MLSALVADANGHRGNRPRSLARPQVRDLTVRTCASLYFVKIKYPPFGLLAQVLARVRAMLVFPPEHAPILQVVCMGAPRRETGGASVLYWTGALNVHPAIIARRGSIAAFASVRVQGAV